MTATSGRTALRPSDAFGPLGRCLRMLLGTSAWGSTTCALTWKVKATPSGRCLYQLAPSKPRTVGSASSFWPTPLAGDATGSRSSKGKARPGEGGLRSLAQEALWPTPRASDGDKGSPNQAFRNGSPTLTALAQPALWATPAARDYRYPNSPESQARRNACRTRGQQLANEVAHLGPTLCGCSAGTESSGPLHPEFVCWLMGFPAGWAR